MVEGIMVARIKTGKSIRGVLNYNENKVKEGTARCIDAVGFGMDAGELSFKTKLNRFQKLTDKNKMSKTNALHISLNFYPDEHLSQKTLKEIARSYIEKIGFGDQPYLVYLHEDAAHPHIHIATVNIKENGQRIDTHNLGRLKSEPARKEIENEFGLMKAGDQKKIYPSGLKPIDLKKALYGKTETKAAISNIVRTVFNSYRFASFKEYSEILKQFNVTAIRGEPGSRMFTKGGLLYQLVDKNGMPIGIPVKSSSIYGRPTLKNIEKKFELNKRLRANYKGRLARTIDHTLQHCTTQEQFIQALKKQNIHAEFRKNSEGYIYGITYIDNVSGCYFNGSEVGKEYSAKRILDKLEQEKQISSRKINPKQKGQTLPSNKPTEPGILINLLDHSSEEAGKILSDLVHATETNTYLPPELLREARKKKRKRSR